MEELSLRKGTTAFVKMKSHANCLGNFGADQLADEGVKKEDAEADKWRPEDEGELGYMTLGPKGEAGGEFLSKRGGASSGTPGAGAPSETGSRG